MISTATESTEPRSLELEDEDEPQRPEDREFFRIPASRFEYLQERIAKLCRRRHKLLKSGPLADAEPITVEKVSTEIEPGVCIYCERSQDAHLNDGRCHERNVNTFVAGAERVYFICRVTGPAAKLEGYEFIATLQHENAGTILRTVPTAKVEEGELDRFRTVRPHCEHCKVRRNRKDSFVVRNVETKETIQVGRNCLGKYIGGGASPKMIAALAELMITVRDCGFEEEGYGYGRGPLVAYLPTFLIFVAASIRMEGWTSRGAAREDDFKVATVDHVWQMLFPGIDEKSKRIAKEFRSEITDADRQTAINAFMMAGEKLITDERLSDYEHNLRIALSAEYVSGKRAGIVGSLIAWYERLVGIAAEKKARREAEKKARAESKHFGTVGERIEFDAVLTRVYDSESDWGVSHGHFFRTADGNIAVWWTSSKRLDVGAAYHIRGTVKKHGDYKGTAQTTFSRCNCKEIEAS